MPPENTQNPTPPPIPVVPHKPTPPSPAQILEATPVMSTVPQASVPKVAEPLNVQQNLGGQATPPAPAATPVEVTLEDEIAQKERLQKELVGERIAIEEESKELFSARKLIEEKITPIQLEEKLSIEHIEELEKERATATDPHLARTLETGRWEEEERRRGIEHRRWEVVAELEDLNKKIHDKELAFNSLLAKESECARSIAALRINIQQRDLTRDLDTVTTERVATEEEHERFSTEYKRLAQLLEDTTKHEEEAHKKEEIVEQKTSGVRTLYEEQMLATERRTLEDERKDAEQKRWAAEDAIAPAGVALSENERHLEEIKKKEADLRAKLRALGT